MHTIYLYVMLIKCLYKYVLDGKCIAALHTYMYTYTYIYIVHSTLCEAYYYKLAVKLLHMYKDLKW